MLAFIYLSTSEVCSYVSSIPNFYSRELSIEMTKRLILKTGRDKLIAIVVDINNLNLINLKFGNITGNRAISLISKVFRDLILKINSTPLCGYLGSGQFLFVCPFKGDGFDAKTCKRILKDKLSFTLMPENLEITVSIAILDLKELINSIEELERTLFMAVEKIKEAGKASITVINSRKIIENEYEKRYNLFSFIKSKILREEIFPLFQPIYNLRNESIFGYELLSRIEDEGELKSIYVYADILDKLDLWQELDKAVLKNIPIWLKSIKELEGKKLFINLSGKFLTRRENREFLLNISRYLPPEKIVFEITEREYIADMDSVSQFIKTLKGKGFLIAIDDFASGFSGFEYVRSVSPDFIKLDGGLIKNVPFSREDQIIVSAVKFVCDKLNIKLLAEWIENQKTLEVLKRMGVEFGQGYFLSKPLKLLRGQPDDLRRKT